MPIYAYRCSTCGYAKDQLQKMSDPLLTVCPACGASTFQKQVTAAGFQLKGSGWYVTDFRGGDAAKKKSPDGDAPPAEAGAKEGTQPAAAAADGAKGESAAKGDAPSKSDAPAKGDGSAKSDGPAKSTAAAPPAPASGDK